MQNRTGKIDVTIAANRRRFYLQRAFRLNTRGSGSNLDRLMLGPRSNAGLMAGKVLSNIPFMIVGAHAANAYMPARNTHDVDLLVKSEDFPNAEQCLQESSWIKSSDLLFPNAKLGLFGSAWHRDKAGEEIDLLSSNQPWVTEAFETSTVQDQNGARIIPLPFIILMKIDSARTVDQGDLGRMLGRLDDSQIEKIIAVVERHYDDYQAPDDIRQYAEFGRWEYQSAPNQERKDSGGR